MRRTLTTMLHSYYDIQEQIVLVYHPDNDCSWSDRCLFLDDDYAPGKQYNHRSILKDEIVVEFDSEDKEDNASNAREVAKRLRKDGFEVAHWKSGNKSEHVHFFIDTGIASSPDILKRIVMRFYTNGLPRPDMQLAASNHLIRAEYGVHEKTGQEKRPIRVDKRYPRKQRLNESIWHEYITQKKRSVSWHMSNAVKDIENHPIVIKLLDGIKFKDDVGDGRERVLFTLIHVLKPEYSKRENGKKELLEFLQEWYRYSGGGKMTRDDIRHKVNYHWRKEYTISHKHLTNLCDELGLSMEEKKDE